MMRLLILLLPLLVTACPVAHMLNPSNRGPDPYRQPAESEPHAIVNMYNEKYPGASRLLPSYLETKLIGVDDLRAPNESSYRITPGLHKLFVRTAFELSADFGLSHNGSYSCPAYVAADIIYKSGKTYNIKLTVEHGEEDYQYELPPIKNVDLWFEDETGVRITENKIIPCKLHLETPQVLIRNGYYYTPGGKYHAY